MTHDERANPSTPVVVSSNRPLVSIVVPFFNDGKYINEAIDSALSQTHSPLEIIVVNDGSTDRESIEILESADWPMTHVIHAGNKGPAAARNMGISASRGKYILPLDADDRIHPTYVERATSILESEPCVGIVYCLAEYFGQTSGRWDLPSYSFERMLLDNIIFTTALFRRQDWQSVGGMNESLRHGMEDYDFWLSLLEIGRKVVQIPEVLFYYRIKKASRTHHFMRSRENVIDTYRAIYRNHPRLFSENQELYATVLRNALIDQVLWRRTYDDILRSPILSKIVRVLLSLYSRIIRNANV